MNARLLFASLVLFALTVLPATATEKLTLEQISAYLNEMRTAQSGFTQTNSDMSVSSGVVYIQRPGRMRLEYDKSEKMLVIAGGGQVAIFDGKSIGNPTQYPLRRTPLNLLLARDVDLSRNDMVINHRLDGNATIVIAQDPDNFEYGQLEIVFTADPVQLRQWSMVDNVGSRTTVVLDELSEGMVLGARLFNIPQEAEGWN